MCCVFLSLPHPLLPLPVLQPNIWAFCTFSSSSSSSSLSLSLSLSLSVACLFPQDFGIDFISPPVEDLTTRMLKQEFLKKWITGLRICRASRKEMGILERKKVIKLSADLAMASTKNGSTNWSRALIANASKEDDNKILVEQILGNDSENAKKLASNLLIFRNRRVIFGSKKILKRRCGSRRVKKMASANSIAKRLVKKRTQVLKRLVPGGESMDEFSLMEETLDYILSLQAQVDVMRHLANATPPSFQS